ncbi:DUF6314 family protein [uncultured Jatrophihabitans sp.]|uniref:DUF6314 family protein n=1 Tax=uncultured Jatrophihabitans sp. TaxID=1610747 RepID=UPI0035CAFDBA
MPLDVVSPASTPLALLGTWRLRRRLADLRTGTFGTMSGTLTLRPDAAGVEWFESGVLVWGGREVDVTRRYLLRDDAEQGWWVFFDDDRPFHPWTPGRAVEHPCRADLYRGLVRVDTAAYWRIAWDVVGPAKHQRILSRLTRSDRTEPARSGMQSETSHQEDR